MGRDNHIPQMREIGWRAIGFVWGYNLIFFVAQEVCKLFTYWLFSYYYSFKAPEQQVYSGQYLTDSFLQFSSGYGDGKKSIVTRRSQIAAKESLKPHS